jgi:hypothetical protein
MASYRNNRAINIEAKKAAKEENKKFLQGPGTVFSKRVPGRRRQKERGEKHGG